MGRVDHGGTGGKPPSPGPGAQRHHKQLTDSAKPAYKVILEEVTQTRKALKLEDFHNINAPRGYKFVPAGDPILTAKCKELARLDGKLVYAVTTINKDNTELSKQVHRVGFHFPAEIVQRALTSLGIDLDKEDAVLRKHEIWPKDEPKRGRGGNRNANLMKRNGKPQLQKGLNLLQMTQEEVDAQAKAAILDMFPAVPHENLYQIILHSFELGTDKVGVQLNDLSLPRRIQLAVVAHIRHIYTDYDSLLHSLGWAGARANVASKTLEVLASWRGDKDDDIDVVEDILREVIVISDDEDDSEVVRPQNMKVITSDPPNLSSISLDTRTGLFDQGKSDRIGARRQIWLDARERRKKPVSMPQARDIHSYYVPRPGRDAPMSVDQKLYEQRLKGLKDHTEDSVPTVQQAQMSSSRSIYDQARLRQSVETGRRSSNIEYVGRVDTDRNLPQPLQVVKTNSKHLFDQNVQTPRQDRSIAKSKLELIPITDEILPSIETPRSERVPTSAFARGAIHIDSPPPQDPRTEYNHLRREAENQSPVKRKRGPSPTIGADNRRREVVYLPIREGRTTYIPQPVDHGLREFPRHEQRPNLANKIVYLPLDDNSKVQSFHRQDRDYAVNRSDTQSSTAQVYLDNAPRYSVQPRDHNSGVKYQYIPLGSVQQRRNPEDSNHSSTSLISFNDSSDTILTHRSLNDEHTHRSLIPLDSPTLRSQYRQYDEVSRVVRQDMVPRRSPSEIQRKQHLQRRPQGPDEIPVLCESQNTRYELVPYSPHNPQAGLPHSPPRTQRYHGHRRQESGLR